MSQAKLCMLHLPYMSMLSLRRLKEVNKEWHEPKNWFTRQSDICSIYIIVFMTTSTRNEKGMIWTTRLMYQVKLCVLHLCWHYEITYLPICGIDMISPTYDMDAGLLHMVTSNKNTDDVTWTMLRKLCLYGITHQSWTINMVNEPANAIERYTGERRNVFRAAIRMLR